MMIDNKYLYILNIFNNNNIITFEMYLNTINLLDLNELDDELLDNLLGFIEYKDNLRYRTNIIKLCKNKLNI
ncbi:unknown similar to AMEV229 [Mythimna separata entomopoxvirus 'L']|uniref:Uncharacterized protein n=1 Tax=Mythimna separata entomopoxvirus 'L' TaxID=1293572 RepID=A0A916KQE7_9POXV|nr:unknown similar to AMEV229 [Mythimna separata entomopoxvirus 'L']CCU56452.1 unknown similar to AMEV229 [Mythimna separata entomopoxvirus 'L']